MLALAQYLDTFTVRTADDGDQEFLKRLYASTRDDLRRMTADPVFVESLIALQQNMQAAGYRNAYPDAQYLIVEQHGEAIGRLVLNIGSDDMRLVDIAFLPQARGKGFGTAVLRALQRSAAQVRLPVRLSVHAGNARARCLYAALGFQFESGNDMAEQMIWKDAMHPE